MSTEIKGIVAVSCDAMFCVKHFKSPGRFATGGPEVARCSEQESILYKLLVRTASFGADFVTFSRIFPEFKDLAATVPQNTRYAISEFPLQARCNLLVYCL